MNSQKSHWAEAAALLYVSLPALIFFAFFVRLAIAIPACSLIAACWYALIRKTQWVSPLRISQQTVYMLALSIAWLFLAGNLGWIQQNLDWIKHYSILNYLGSHPWPATIKVDGLSGEWAIRYSIGWYLVPAFVIKYFWLPYPKIISGIWSVIGVFLFFRMLIDILPNKRAVFIAPLIFMLFSGADIIGTAITHFQVLLTYHIEWWDGWIEYGSNMTSMFWVPQHAIPTWIGIALMIRQTQRATILPYLALYFSAVCLWSPFSAIGLAPFALVLLRQYGFREIVLDWRPIASIALVAAPIFFYLTADAGSMPHGPMWVGDNRYVWKGGPWFSAGSFALFCLIEFALPAVILLLVPKFRQPFILVAIVSLLLIPLYRVGAFNDFGMRTSIAGLAVLSISAGELIAAGPRIAAIAMAIALAFGVPTAMGEVLRGFGLAPHIDTNAELARSLNDHPEVLPQYFARLPVAVLRGLNAQPANAATASNNQRSSSN